MATRPTPDHFMDLALVLAREAAAAGEVPVGAVLASGAGDVIARGRNRSVEISPLRHAEVEALEAALAREDRWTLGGATLYVTAEPCLMCLGAMVQARIGGLVFGCPEPRFGGVALLQGLWKEGRYPHRFPVAGGLRDAEARDLLQGFFREKRTPPPGTA